MTLPTLDDIHALAQQLRVDTIRCSTSAGSGHPTSGMSAADLMAVLMARHFKYDWQRPDDPANDHLIFPRDTPPRCCTRRSRRPGSSPTRSW
jgi:transketolase